MPVFFMVLFNVYVLNSTMEKWFTLPGRSMNWSISTKSPRRSSGRRATRPTPKRNFSPLTPETKLLLAGNSSTTAWLARFCLARGILAASIMPVRRAKRPIAALANFPARRDAPRSPWTPGQNEQRLRLWQWPFRSMWRSSSRAIEEYHRAFYQLSSQQASVRRNYLLAADRSSRSSFCSWPAGWRIYLARQISGPISALLRAVEEVSKGNLGYRVKVTAVDELAQLVSGFNRMTADLEANRTEIEARRRFTEAILESIPTGVISVDSNGAIQLVNKALAEIFPGFASAQRRAARRSVSRAKMRPRSAT